MIEYLHEQFNKNKSFRLITALFGIISIWWLSIYFRGLTDNNENVYFVLVYPVLAVIGGVFGMYFAKKWGGFSSALGRSINLLALGLLFQFLGQVLYNYYSFVLGIEVPYPSIGDWAYFSSVIFYIVGVYLLAKVSGIKFALKSVKGKILAFGIPALVLLVSYVVLIRGYDFSGVTPLLLFFDFGWPFGQAVYVSIAILALFISKNILGGMMRKPIMLLISALILQYISDFTFSYQFSQGTLYIGGPMDYLYFVSYFLMTISLFAIGNMFYKVQES